MWCVVITCKIYSIKELAYELTEGAGRFSPLVAGCVPDAALDDAGGGPNRSAVPHAVSITKNIL